MLSLGGWHTKEKIWWCCIGGESNMTVGGCSHYLQTTSSWYSVIAIFAPDTFNILLIPYTTGMTKTAALVLDFALAGII